MSDEMLAKFPGVSHEALLRLNDSLEDVATWERKRRALQAQVDEELEAVRKKHQQQMDEYTTGLSEAKKKTATIYTDEVLGKADNEADVITLRLRAGDIDLRSNPEALIIDDEAVLVKWGRARGVLRRISEWKRTVPKTKVKNLLKERPELRSTLRGAHFERGRTLSMKPVSMSVELVEAMEPLKVTL